ncbi:MAG: diaminopimelate epimerase [Bacteroidales bacterium]|nr:diaminopimelate epimerase [Bacteroidales bacterium]
MKIQFTKMEGLGNDYVYVDTDRFPIADPASVARRVSDRHFGIGSDGLVLIARSASADFSMRIFNADGSEAQMCGNASRCIGKYLYERGLTDKTVITLDTLAGVKTLTLRPDPDGTVRSVAVSMGRFGGGDMLSVTLPDGRVIEGCVIDMGNPHFVIFADDYPGISPETEGPLLEKHPAFPEGTNVEFLQRLSPSGIRMRVWERGSGITMACGTGACASAAAATLKGLVSGSCRVRMDGGELTVQCDPRSREIVMEGPASIVFDGTMDI